MLVQDDDNIGLTSVLLIVILLYATEYFSGDNHVGTMRTGLLEIAIIRQHLYVSDQQLIGVPKGAINRRKMRLSGRVPR